MCGRAISSKADQGNRGKDGFFINAFLRSLQDDDRLITWHRPARQPGSTGVLAERPNEPVGDPPLRQGPSAEYGGGGRAQLTPNPMWLDVRRVQTHMAKARKDRAPSS
ncbi:hypothetical protein AK812_SmicGene39304 [Symbiodinium microadriaticum]|uniref:Uncharacterized protein n=1 Tax=Symbiodinium microadriaticum TaxID=2951 RepID=A0A1Q9CBJ3_SYMMI|nr:hypothetical protein AK812_SmicGene39304 [Symbiodinium microadriaticum]